MKKTIYCKFLVLWVVGILLLIISTQAQVEQVKSNVFLMVNDVNNLPIAYPKCWLNDIADNAKITGQYQANGYIKFEVYSGHQYSLSFEGYSDYDMISIPANRAWEIKKTIVFNPKQNKQFVENMIVGTFDTVHQSKTNIPFVDDRHSGVVIALINENLNPVVNEMVGLVNIEGKRWYKSITDSKGEALFVVPISEKYIIVIGDAMDYGELPELTRGGGYLKIQLDYITSNVEEHVSNDTITQSITNKDKNSSDRAYVKLYLRDLNGMPLPDEEICFDVAGSKKVYFCKTNKDGIAEAILPKNAKYILNFKYERGIDLLDYKNVSGSHQTEIEYSYAGSKAIEEHYRQQQANTDDFKGDFRQITIKPLPNKDELIQKTVDGFVLDFEEETPVSGVCVHDNVLFVPDMFYGKRLIAIDLQTKKTLWTREMEESGLSPLFCKDGIIYVSTYSCTLYAIKADNGELLWSKWLFPIVYSTASGSGNLIFMTLANDLGTIDSKNEDNAFLLISLDEKTGDIEWQCNIDQEALVFPVVQNDFVFVTTMKGTLYKIDAATGKCLAITKGNFIAPPSVVNDKILIPELVGGRIIAKTLHVADLKTVNQNSGYQTALLFEDIMDLSCVQKMNFTGFQIAVKSDLAYINEQNAISCYRISDWKLVWRKTMPKTALSSDFMLSTYHQLAPYIIGNTVVATNPSGYVYFFNYKDGDLLHSENLGAKLFTPCIINHGYLISTTIDGKVVCKKSRFADLENFLMLNGDAQHNLIY